MKTYSPDVIALAAAHGIPESELPLHINGCSGGLSWVYRLAFGRDISCEDCCDMHDLLYTLGKKAGTRKQADQQLRDCARKAGNFPPGVIGVVRKIWRWARAWAMYAAVRICGAKYWEGD